MYIRIFPLVATTVICGINSLSTSPIPPSTHLVEQFSSQENSPDENIEFKIIFGGGGQTKEGQPFAVTVYKSSDGVTVRKTVELYKSDVAAKQALRLKSKVCIGEASQEKSNTKEATKNDGRIVCQTKGKDEPIFTSIIYASAKYLYKIDSASLKHALLIERNKIKSNPRSFS